MNEWTKNMIRTIAALFLFFAVHTASALDIQAIDPHRWPTNDEEYLVYTLLFGDETWSYEVKSFAEDFGTENVADMILGYVEPVFDAACVSTNYTRERRLCRRGISAMCHLMATNALPFLENAVWHGSHVLCLDAFYAYGIITECDESFIALGERAVGKSALGKMDYICSIASFYKSARAGYDRISPEIRLKIAIRVINNPFGNYLSLQNNDDMFLSDFPFYRNSAERLRALTALINDPIATPEVRAKYEREVKRLKALPPRRLISATERIEAQLANLPETEARKKAIAKIGRVVLPVVAVLVGVTLLVHIRKRRKHR